MCLLERLEFKVGKLFEKLFGRHFNSFLERFIVNHISHATALLTICQAILPQNKKMTFKFEKRSLSIFYKMKFSWQKFYLNLRSFTYKPSIHQESCEFAQQWTYIDHNLPHYKLSLYISNRNIIYLSYWKPMNQFHAHLCLFRNKA